MSLAPLRQRPAWQPLESHSEVIRNRHLRELFAEDPQRAEKHDSSTSRLIERYRRPARGANGDERLMRCIAISYNPRSATGLRS